MDIIASVLRDCQFAFSDMTEHNAKKRKAEEDRNNSRGIKLSLPECMVNIKSTFQDNLVTFEVEFIEAKLQDARSVASDISQMSCCVDAPKLHLTTEHEPDKFIFMYKVQDHYSTCVLFSILSNFPRNLSENEIL